MASTLKKDAVEEVRSTEMVGVEAGAAVVDGDGVAATVVLGARGARAARRPRLLVRATAGRAAAARGVGDGRLCCVCDREDGWS
jgi:hypothetical protein